METIYKAKIFWGDIGTIQNQMNKFLEGVGSVISVTQSTTGSMSATMYITLIYTPSEVIVEPESTNEKELIDIDYMPLDR